MVMAPTATSPPYFSKEELKQIEIILSLDCITKTEDPRAKVGSTIAGFKFTFFHRILNVVFFPNRKARTQIHDKAWEKIVARAAPRTPMWKPKIKMGSRIIFATAPMSTESIPVFANPWAVIKAFMPSVS